MANVGTKQAQPEHSVRFWVFELAGQLYGVHIGQTKGVVQGPGREGVWAYQGRDVALHSLPRLLGLDLPAEEMDCVLFVRRNGALRGFLVPSPRDIVALAVEDIFPLPPLLRRMLGDSTLLWGVGRRGEDLLLLVDLMRYEEEAA